MLRRGEVTLTELGGGVGRLAWPAGEPPAVDALLATVADAFERRALVRVEALVPTADLASLRAAGRAGLRREGVVRGAASDLVLLARLAGDPQPGTAEGFFGMLNASLPRKRAIAQGVIRHRDGRVLLVEQTYKREWELPGGVVDPGESPRAAARREVAEELGVDLQPVRLLAVNWLPPWFAWDDACVFLFDFGRHDDGLLDRLRLQPAEISAVHWCDEPTAAARGSRSAAPVLRRLWQHDGAPLYLEGGADPRGG